MGTGITETVIRANKFTSLNPVQEHASKHIGKNLVVCAPTASGKTTVFEMELLHFAGLGKKSIYISPLKALTFEHYNDIKNKYKYLNIRFGIATGDLDSSSKNLSSYDVLFMTYEKLDSVIRHAPDWLSQIGLVCIDEIHEIDSDRGATLEVLITQLRHNYPDIVFLGLSATIGNPQALSKWLGSALVKSNYRPIPLDIGIAYQNTIYFESGKKELEVTNKEDYLCALVEDVLKIGKQAIVFCNSRSNTMNFSAKYKQFVKKYLSEKEKETLRQKAKEIGEVLESPTKQCLALYSCVLDGTAFHHAGLVYKQRQVIEEEFRKGNIKVIFATPTLAAGINLPAYRVIITTVYRFSNGSMVLIPVNEFHQMSGRAGRPRYDSKGEAVVMVSKESDIQRVYNSYVSAQPTEIESQLSKPGNLRSVLLSIILLNNITTTKELKEYITKTFYFFVFGNYKALMEIVREIIEEFVEFGFLKRNKENIELTLLGKKVCLLYIDPLSANNILNDLKAKAGKPTKLIELLFTLCNTSECYPYISVKRGQEDLLISRLEEIKENIYFDYEDINLLEKIGLSELLFDWVDEMPEDKIVEKHNTTPGQLQEFVNKVLWINHCVLELAKENKSDIKLYREYLELETQLKYGVKKELLSLVQLKNIGRVRARKLFNSGIKGISDIKKEPERFISVVGRIGLETLKELQIDYQKSRPESTQTGITDY